jgi:hypothetical protein
VIAAAAAGLIVAGVAGADNSISFSDTVGDGGTGLDITSVDISNYEGSLSFTINVHGSFVCSSDGDGEPALVALDLDQNPDTGSAFYGTEVAFAPDAIGDAHLLRARGWDFRGVRQQLGLGGGRGTGVGFYFIDSSKLGLAPNGGFNVVVATLGSPGDTAPNIRTFNFQMEPGGQPPVLGPDRRAPHVIAYSAGAVHGKAVGLRYWVLDGRGTTREIIRVYRGKRMLKTIWTPLRDSNPFHLSQVVWRTPSKVRGRLRFSVRSLDAAGNKSRRSWASLTVR